MIVFVSGTSIDPTQGEPQMSPSLRALSHTPTLATLVESFDNDTGAVETGQHGPPWGAVPEPDEDVDMAEAPVQDGGDLTTEDATMADAPADPRKPDDGQSPMDVDGMDVANESENRPKPKRVVKAAKMEQREMTTLRGAGGGVSSVVCVHQ